MIIKHSNGTAYWKHLKGYQYKATGKDYKGKRFSILSSSWPYINGINIWQGTKWLVDLEGKKHTIESIYN